MSDSVQRSIELKAPIERVWQALTDHKEVGAIFRVALKQPFAVGRTSSGNVTYPGYEHMRWEATVTKMERPTLFAFTWPHPLDPGDPKEDLSRAPRTLVEFRLEPIPGGTRLTVTESGFAALPPDRREGAMRDNAGGWEMQLGNVKAHVEA